MMTENKRYYIGNGENCTICDSNQGGSDFYNMLTQFEAVDRLNEQEETINELKKENQNLKQMMENFVNKDAYWEKKAKQKIQDLEERNKRQYNRLKELTELMYERQWGKLENMVEEWEKQDELLEQEWGTYYEDK